MARWRVGPVRFGGGRRVSVTGRLGPFGVTVGGGYKRRRSGGRDPVDGQPTYSQADDEAAGRMGEKLWAEYCDYYCSLTPTERSIQDHWNWEVDQFSSGIDNRSLRLALLAYLIAQSVVVAGLFEFGVFGWISVAAFAYFANLTFALKISPRLKPITRSLSSSEVRFWLAISGSFCALVFGWLTLRSLGSQISWLLIACLNYAIYVAARHFYVRILTNQFLAKEDAYRVLTESGYLQPDVLYATWYNVCAAHLLLKHSQIGRYFAISFWFPYLHLKRVLKGNRLGMMPVQFIAKPFVPFRKKMPKNVPQWWFQPIESPYVHAYRENGST